MTNLILSTATRSRLLLALTFGLATALAAQVVQQGPVTVRRDLHHDVSPPLRDLIRNAPPPSLERHEAEPVGRIPLPPGLVPLAEDPVRQRTTMPATQSVGLSFEGLGQGQYGFSVTGIPPDTEGAVGATQYVQWVNTSFAIFNKSNGALIAGPTLGNTLWLGFGGGCETDNDGDVIALYDKLANRWVMSQFAVDVPPAPPYLQCVAVSTTQDATGTWYRYSFQYDDLDDYPKMGVWPDAYYETFNMFNTHGIFVGSEPCAYDRTAMLNGQLTTEVCFPPHLYAFGLLPADVDGTTLPPAGSPNYMMSFGTNILNLYQFHVDFNIPANSTFTGPTAINVADFYPLCGGDTCVPQAGTGQQLDSLADRLMYRLAYRNFGSHESLVVNHSVTVSSGGGGVRWYEIQNPGGTPVLAQQGTFAPDSNYRWMGSVAMDQAGDLAVGYSISSGSVYPSIAFAGRVPTDPPGALEAETIVVGGTGFQAGSNRWGDYSAMTVDPVDDCTFWYTQEYMQTNGDFNWNTRIVSFSFPGCSNTLTVSTSGDGTVTSTDGFINCPGTCSHSYPGNTQVTLNATPAQGWTLAGWSGACSGTGSCNVTMTQNLSVGACSHSYLSNTQVTLNATSAPGWTFAGWSGAGSGTGSCNVTMTQNLSVGATFTQLSYTLTVSTSGNGSVTSTDGFINCPGTCSHSYLSNTQVTLNATSAPGWTFAGWSGACGGTGSCNVTMTQNLSVGATFTQLSYTLTVSTSGNGSVTSTDGFINCPGTCSHSYLSNTQVTLNATPAPGWTWAGWSGACSGTGSCNVTMTQNLSVGATFTQLSYTLTVSITGSGAVTSADGFINCPGTCSHSYLSSTPVMLSATPGQGWLFGAWSGCDRTNNSVCTVTMNSARNVTATFVPAELLSVTVAGSGTVVSGAIDCGTVCSNLYKQGTQVKLTALPGPGSTLSSWTGCDTMQGDFCTVTMSGARNVTANFTAVQVTLTSLTFKPASVKGGQTSVATITLGAAAPPGGLGVGFSSDNPRAAHPPSLIVVPGGATSTQFAVRTSPVRQKTVVKITASDNTSQTGAMLTVNPR